MTTADDYVNQVIAHVPHETPERSQIAMELRSHIAERLERGQPLDDVLGQLGDPLMLAESYLAAVPLVSARFWPRAAAKIIDFLMVAAGAAALGCVLWVTARGPWGPLLAVFAFALGFPLYTALAEYRAGQTLGKRLMGIRVVRESGARIGLGQSLLRQLPYFGEFFFIDVVFALFTDKKQRAFELLTKTRAVVILLCVALAATPVGGV
jgi:uncharacterized RDD family membrane protein YckC